MRTYEGVIIFHQAADDDALTKRIDVVRGEVEKLEGKVDSFTRMGKNMFERPLKKQQSGIFVLMVFEMDPEKIPMLRERCKFNESILRVHIVTARRGKKAVSA